jgi:hypothetical protein
VLVDLARLRAGHSRLRQPVGTGSRRVLVLDFADFVAHAKTESLLARALETHGFAPLVLTTGSPRWAGRYWRALGLTRILDFRAYFDGRGAEGDLLAPRADFRAVSKLEYRGVDVGRQALATMIRTRHQGRLDLGERETRAQLQRLLARAVDSVEAAERFLDDVRPDLVLVNDALYVGIGAVFEASLNRGIPVIQWVAAHRDDALVLKRFSAETKREHPFSLAEETWQAVRREPWDEMREAELRAEFVDRYVVGRWGSYYNRPYGLMFEADELRRRLGLEPAKKTATIFSHILWDSTLFWGEDLFEHYEEWLVETVRAAAANPRLNWIVKFHPGNVWKLRRDGVPEEVGDQAVLERRVGRLPDHVKLLPADTDVSTYALFDVTDYCVTVRGTVGIEAAAYGIAVVTAGTGRYSEKGFTLDSASAREYLDRLTNLQDVPSMTPEQVESAKKYAHALFVRRPARFTSFELTYKGLADVGHPLDHNVELGVRDLEDIRRARDLQAFAEWAGESDSPDFLARPSDGGS